MPVFDYNARDSAGKTVSDSVDAPGRREALRLLAARGMSVAQLSERGAARPAPRRAGAVSTASKSKAAATPATPAIARARGETAPRRAERLPFLEALHDLTAGGLSAGEAIRLLATRISDPRLRELSGGLWARLSEGSPLSRAMADFPEVFDTSTTNLIHAGESTGSLNDTLARLIQHLNEQRELRRQVINAMLYPALMIFVSFGVVLFFLFFLLPRLQTLLSSLGGKMPVSTQILVGTAHFGLHYGVFIGAAAAFAGISFWRWRTTEAGREATDTWLLNVPLVGPFLVSQTVLSFSQTLSVLLENGITASDALRMTEKQISNTVHRQAFGDAIARVLEGEALSLSLRRTGCFPDLVLDRLSVGENTGNIVPSLKDIAKGYRKQTSNQLELFTKVFASLVLCCVFTLVGFIAFSIVAAVFSVSASFKMG